MALSRAARRLLDPRIHPVIKLVLVGGLSYPFLPIDLIPDRLPWIGHLDNFGLPALGAGAGAMLLRDLLVIGIGMALIRKRALQLCVPLIRLVAGGVIGRFALRLILGRWPDPKEHQAFLGGLWSTSHSLPPLLRATACVPAARTLLGRAMLLDDSGSGTARFSEAQRMGNLLTIWAGPKVRFLHIEKTAGSSLIAALAAHFHPLQIRAAFGDRYAHDPSFIHQQDAVAAHRQAALVWGHYDLPALISLDGDTTCFRLCLLRDPARRILSLYYFWRGNREEPGSHVRFARELGLLDFLRLSDPTIRNEIDNLYVRRLTGRYASAASDPLAEDPQAALDDAMAALGQLDFVGVSERLDETLAMLGRLLGFEPPARTPRINVQSAIERNALLSVTPAIRETLTDEINAELDHLTRLDRVLYQHARARLDDRLGRAQPASVPARSAIPA